MGSSQTDQSNDTEESLETDPTNRFQRCDEILGEGAYKNVYRAFDQEEGVEVAWNQLRIDHLSKKEAQKILSEIEILQSIRNEHIINFYASWSTKAPNGGERIVFVTELMSSGTLKQYLKKTLKGALKPKVLKSWCRQILQGLVYLHTHDPPIIHRDLKCDNIFINGNNGQLKIGDLGLAVVRHRTHVSSVLGTPEFMAPELYDERYDEKVDIYAFGMCVLEMVTKEYPYSECTNQAQIYRKVTQGIKPQSLEQVQDPETREFINRCLDHDDRTRPSAQELLDSNFLLACASAPPMSAAMGLFHHPTRSLTTDGMEFMDGPLSSSATTSSNRSSFADPFMPSISPTSTYSMPSLPSVLRTQPLPVKAHPQPITIPTTEFTTTTVDADNKTYHIRSNLLPQTPTSNGYEDTQETSNADVATTQSEEPETPTLHSHANSKTCCIQVLQYGEAVGNHLNLKMICTCPVAGPRDVAVAAGTHEIKFPFDLDVDTVEEVVAEMVREQILSGDDREEATSRIQELVDGVVSVRATAKQTKESHIKDDHVRKNNHKNHRQLNVPPASDMDQYGTSPTESIYDHYSSIGSSASIGWHGAESPIESDQGYGTVHHPKSPQNPPAITETTFPPLNAQPLKNNFSLPPERYSDVVQHPVATLPAHHPLSPLLVGRDRAASVPTQRPLSTLYLDQKSVSPDNKASTTTTRNKDEDVGYTSPYRHGVSSSSITSHRRSPSVDAAVMIASAPLIAPTPTPSLAGLLATGAKPLEDMSLVGSYQGTSGTIPDVQRSPPRELSPMLTHAEVLHRSQQQKQHPISPDSGISSATSSLNEPAPFAPPSLLPLGQERLPHSANPVHIEPQHSHRHAFAPQQANGDSNVILMTSEAKKDIEQWSNKVQHPMDPHTSGYNESNYSSCPELSDDEEILDDDLKILREKQRQELEFMRLQHVQQWEKMMKLKEQKGLRKTETNTSPPSSISSAPTIS